MADQFDLESLVTLEQTFYDQGYEDGYAHGRIHGLIEGRALGREKGFEMWEELGFYQGFAMMWRTIYIAQNRQDERALHHIKHLLDLISQFPKINPSTSPPPPPPPPLPLPPSSSTTSTTTTTTTTTTTSTTSTTTTTTTTTTTSTTTTPAPEVDIEKLFRQIRSRYKALCATLGVKPSLRAADGSAIPPEPEPEDSVDPSVVATLSTSGAADSGMPSIAMGVDVDAEMEAVPATTSKSKIGRVWGLDSM